MVVVKSLLDFYQQPQNPYTLYALPYTILHMKTYNWGIIGLGRIAHKFAKDLQVAEHMKLHAVASRSEERAKQFAEQYNAPHYYDSYEALMDCPDLDVVYIATPHHAHHTCAIMCLNHKIPVLCEKPFAMNSEQVAQMIETARANDTFLMEALWTRFLPTTLEILQLIEADTIGKVLSVKADFGFNAPYNPESRLFNPELGGGALLDIGIYPVFLALLVLGKPDQIKAMASFGTTGVDEDCGILFNYDNGAMAHLHATFRVKTKTEAFIYGEKGTIHIHSRWHEPSWFSVIDDSGRPSNHHFDYNNTGYLYEALEVVKCLEEGKKESDLLPLSFSQDLINLLDRIRMEAGINYIYDEKE